ncbi:hypothetical protein BC940DRAFT_177113 [Gongronella butleri]|nr:hypothetical protein BC940DRAFT_177113 [Gongronella butleri]
MQAKLDTQHNLINTRLVCMNKTLCMLQSVLQNRKRGDNDDFDLTIQPFVRAAPLTGRPIMCLRVRLHTRLNLDWDKCHLNLDFCCRPPLLESSNGGGLREPVTSPGETISLVFDDLQPLDQEHASTVQYFWQREIELDTARLPLPLDVATHLVMNLGAPDVDPTETPMDAGSEDQGDSTAVFFVMETAIDVLHYAVPVPAYFAKQITLNGFQAVAAQAHTGPNSQHRQQDHPLANAQSVIKLRFISMLDNDQLYRSILSTMLGEGLPEKHTSSVVRDAEHAYFALASQPKDFVHVELAKVVHHGDDLIVTLTVMSANKMVQLKVETALVSRLLMYTDDDIMDENGVSSLPKDFYERQRQLQEQLAVVEATYQQSVDDVTWRDLAQIHELICTQQANIAIPLFGFVDQNT